jgi:hypothetical protein
MLSITSLTVLTSGSFQLEQQLVIGSTYHAGICLITSPMPIMLKSPHCSADTLCALWRRNLWMSSPKLTQMGKRPRELLV